MPYVTRRAQHSVLYPIRGKPYLMLPVCNPSTIREKAFRSWKHMQRYEREIESILRAIEFDGTPAHPPESESGSALRKKPADNPLWTYNTTWRRLPDHTVAEKLVKGTCFALLAALVLVPYLPLVSAGLIMLSLGLLIASLKHLSLDIEVEDDLAAKDLRWVDVTVQARPGTQGKPGDFIF